jgi:hypothetical protein
VLRRAEGDHAQAVALFEEAAEPFARVRWPVDEAATELQPQPDSTYVSIVVVGGVLPPRNAARTIGQVAAAPSASWRAPAENEFNGPDVLLET